MKLIETISEYGNDLLSLLYPEYCCACKGILVRNEKVLCTSCVFHLPKTNYQHYDDNPVSKVFWGRVPVQYAISFLHFTKGGMVQSMLHHLKYKGMKDIGFILGNLYGNDLRKSDLHGQIDVIVPVPLHKKKQRKRGFNQSEYFARGLQASMMVDIEINNLVRVSANETQTNKSRFQRWQNVESVFQVKNPSFFMNKHILLIDDVITTGATIESCANELFKIPGVMVSAASIAYTSF